MDWAPSDLVAAFLLAGALQNARRRAAVYAVLGDDPDADMTAGGDGVAAHAGAPRGCTTLSGSGACLGRPGRTCGERHSQRGLAL